MILRPVTDADADFLYTMLSERTPDQSISHRQMPTLEQHKAFMAKNPYHVWYIVEVDGKPAGNVNLSDHDEVGVFICADYQGKGLGEQAVRELMRRHERTKYLANINPVNSRSQNLFQKLGFKCIQFTFVKESA